ncbi:hypothetical protein [Streptomyces cyaneofuscatus]
MSNGSRAGLDPHVQAYVRATPGFERIVQRGLDHALALLALPGRRFRVDIHATCGGGPPLGRRRGRARRPAPGRRNRRGDRAPARRPTGPDVIRALFTEHEMAALRLLAQGCTQVEIAKALRIRPETVGLLLSLP